MSGTYTLENSGDWSTVAIWSTASVPDSASAEVTLDANVGIGVGESFLAADVVVEPSASMQVGGTLDIAAGLTVEAGTVGGVVVLNGGSLSAGSIDVEPGLGIQGVGRIASPSVLTNEGMIAAVGQIGQTLTLTPAAYMQSQLGELAAIGDALDLAPTGGSSGFINITNSTLTGGTYAAENGGTLELPGPITAIESATVMVEQAVPAFGAPQIIAGGTSIEACLTRVGIDATLSLEGYYYSTSNTLDVTGTVALDDFAMLNAPRLDLNAEGQLVGVGTVTGEITNDGEIGAKILSGMDNLLVLSGSVEGTGSLMVGDGAILELVQGSTEVVDFGIAPLPGVLRLDNPGGYRGIIEGFELADVHGTAYGNAIDLPGFTPGTLSDLYQGTTASGTLDIFEPGSIVAQLTFSGDYLGDTFHLFSDQQSGTDIALAPLTEIPCFVRGTRIATPRGNVAAEDLRVGECVFTASGSIRPIVWIGQRRIAPMRHTRPELVYPVSVHANAFDAGSPVCDLRVSPDHAVFAEGVLIPAKYLLNGITVVQEPVFAVHYFHLELDRHDVVLAEGLPVESYLDTGNRAQFENEGPLVHIQADFSARNWNDACARLATDGPPVVAVRRQLLDRAAELGYTRCAKCNLHVRADDRVILPAAVKANLYQFLLPAGTREVRLVSSTAVPAGFDLASTDCRTLGARIGAVFLNGQFVQLDSSHFAEGFYPVERNGVDLWRWTNGLARLILPKAAQDRPVALELLVREVLAGWERPQGVSKLLRRAIIAAA